MAGGAVIGMDTLLDFIHDENQAVTKIGELVEAGTTIATTTVDMFRSARKKCRTATEECA